MRNNWYFTFELRSETEENSVTLFAEPRWGEDPIFGLTGEVDGLIVDDDSLGKISPEFAEIFDIGISILESVGSIESMGY